jgi:hypothetical protein
MKIENKSENFDRWAFIQCVVNGHKIVSIKNDAGENIKWRNVRTGEIFIVQPNPPSL